MKSKNGCPFCQEDVIHIVKSAPPASQGLQIECENCGARGPILDYAARIAVNQANYVI